MTWLGWLMVVDFTLSAGYFIAKNGERKPLDPSELAVKVVVHVAYVVGVLLVGTGSIR